MEESKDFQQTGTHGVIPSLKHGKRIKRSNSLTPGPWLLVRNGHALRCDRQCARADEQRGVGLMFCGLDHIERNAIAGSAPSYRPA